MYLVLDTESIGYKTQNHYLVQLSYLIFDENECLVSEFDSLVKPLNWNLDEWEDLPFMWTQDDCEMLGEDLEIVLNHLLMDLEKCDWIIGHNIDFDIQLLLSNHHVDLNKRLNSIKKFCTMKQSVNLCKLPFFRGGYKYPTLEEAVHILTEYKIDEDLLHHAYYDAFLCSKVFFEILHKKKSYF